MTADVDMNESKQARRHDELIAELLDSRIPKTEREHAAAREIEALRTEAEQHFQQAMSNGAKARAAQARAERLAEALRELVAVFSESGMYDEEVFARARAALDQEPPRDR